jgi:hypothetical protein
VPEEDVVLPFVERDALIPKQCVCCGIATHSRSVFIPNDSQAFGGCPTKQRYIIYALCDQDAREADSTTLDRIERRFLDKIALGMIDSLIL